jgi:ABC-2 type transport system ATP-binding protein
MTSVSPTMAIETHGLRRSFGETEALRGVDLAVPGGSIHGFLGPNGAGKTTLVRILCTLLRPTAGTARVAGLDVTDRARDVRFLIGVALQEAALDPGQTGRELLDLQARLFGVSGAQRERRMKELADLVDLGPALDRRVKTYSGGMRRRLDLALALMHEPWVLFLDEPTTGLDPVSRMQIWEEVRRLNRERGVTIFLTTQYLEEADQLAERVSILAAGQIAAEGTPDELKRAIGRDVVIVSGHGPMEVAQAAVASIPGVERVDRAGHEMTLAVDDGPAAVPAVATRLAAVDGFELREISLRRPSLDDVFLKVTGSRIEADADADDPSDANTPEAA